LDFKSGIHKKIDFEVTDQQKQETTAVSFWDCPAVDFVDIEILKRFPNLNGLTFFRSNIPIPKNIFTVELKMIQYLSLERNKIKTLEAHVFDELVELKWIDLRQNEIEEILHPIFAKNKKLEYISLSTNKIQTLHPNLFDDLPRLEEVWFSSNPIVDKKFNQSNIKMLNVELKPLFENYLLKYGYRNRVKELELVS
jgi:Leucine-rich repeat (LRR) protein